MLSISDAAIDLIVSEEITDAAYYTKHYQHFDWPEGDSGPTVGIGYDCGYVTADELRKDWSGIVSEETVEALLKAVGKKKTAARNFVAASKLSVTISYVQAITQFREREIPKWIKQTSDAFQNCDHLSPDSLGGLLSLAYNRGLSFAADKDSRKEMREIRACMARGDFGAIPQQIRLMKRLWPTGGLAGRREREAQLFERGLVDCRPLSATVIQMAPANAERPAPALAVEVAHPAQAAVSAPSKSGLAFLASVAMLSRTVWTTIVGFGVSAGDGLGYVMKLLPEIKTEVDGSMSALDSFTSALKVNKEAIATAVLVACVVTIIFRHTRDKIALINKDKDDAGDSGDQAGARG